MAALYGKMDIRIREVDMPEIEEDEILVKVISNGICNSTHKAALVGKDHIRVPNDVEEHPVMTGHEFAGEIVKVGKKWQERYKEGSSCVLQAGIRYKGSEYAPGYSFPFFGGNTTYTIIPNGYIEMDCLLTYEEDYFAFASMAEPISCVIAGYHSNYRDYSEDWIIYDHLHGVKKDGYLALMASCGPMGISAIDYAIHGPYHPKKIVVTEVNENRLARAKELISEEYAASKGIELIYLNMNEVKDAEAKLMEMTDGHGFDDIIVFVPRKEVIELGSAVMAHNGCLNFFAGPIDKEFSANVNFYDIHYRKAHYCGNSGGNLDDINEMMKLSLSKQITPEYMITHVAGLQAAPDIILNLPDIPGGKKLIYTHTDIPLMAIEDFEKHPEDECFVKIAKVLRDNKMVWNKEAEKLLLKYKTVL